MIKIKGVCFTAGYFLQMKSAAHRPSFLHVMALVLALLLLAVVILFATRPAAAEPQLDYSIRLTIKGHYESRLAANACTRLFRYNAMNIENWAEQGDTVRVQVVFSVEYIGATSLYGNSEMSRNCLGKNAGPGFFERDKTYPSASLIYTLSKWAQGWHVDKLEFQP